MKCQSSVTKEELVSQLKQVLTEEAVQKWFATKNRQLDGFTPNELMERGDEHIIRDLIWDMLMGCPS